MKGRSLRFLLTLGLAAVSTVQAQGPATPDSDPNSKPAYQDRVIEGLKPTIEDADVAAEATYDNSGWARQLRFETRIGQDSFTNASQRTSGGVALYGLIETPNFGVLSLDGQLSRNPGGGALTLRQRDLPLDGGWSVNNELGVIGSLAPDLTRRPSRVYVPGYLLEGIETEWTHRGQGLQLQASTGQPGRLDGSIIGSFQRLPGMVTSAGAQIGQGPWSLAARLAQASGVEATYVPTLSGGLVDARSAQFALRRESDGKSVQANLVSTSNSALLPTRSGLWVDGEARDGANIYSGGLFWLDPGLSWAGQPMANDAAGGYIRSAWQTRQWSADASLDLLRSVSNPSNAGAFLAASGRWRYSRRLSFSAGASVRSFNGNAWNNFGELRWQTDWGSSGLRLDLTNEPDQLLRTQKLSLDQDWQVPTGWALATSVSAGRATSAGQQQTLLAAAASVNAPLTSSATLRGNLTTERIGIGNSSVGINVGLSWRLTPRWSLEGNYNLTQGRTQLSQSIDPLATPLPFDSITTTGHSLFIGLRWQESAGSRGAPLGGQPLQGGGRIEGTVFLDANSNGHQEASESGAAGVTVYLDNRYSVRTDAQGHFEFPFVAAGPRVITVLNETLPLPWVAPRDGAAKVEVRVRENRRVDIGVVRQGSE
jgi:hypothetical protein